MFARYYIKYLNLLFHLILTINCEDNRYLYDRQFADTVGEKLTLISFNLSLNLAIRSSWSEPQLAPSLVFADCTELLIFGCKEYNQSDFGIDHLVMSMYRVFSCVVGRGCLLWPVHFLGKTLLAFALLHSVLQGQMCLLLQVFPDFLLLHSSPL